MLYDRTITMRAIHTDVQGSKEMSPVYMEWKFRGSVENMKSSVLRLSDIHCRHSGNGGKRVDLGFEITFEVLWRSMLEPIE